LREPEGFAAIWAAKTRLLRSVRNDNSLYRDSGADYSKKQVIEKTEGDMGSKSPMAAPLFGLKSHGIPGESREISIITSLLV
jgi:hypothetical protein